MTDRSTGLVLQQYLERIGYTAAVTPDLETLVGIHRSHIAAIPYEALVIPFGRPRPLTEASFHEYAVAQGRGGWCYEMNGLLTYMLSEAGFNVTRVGAGIGMVTRGSAVYGNHLVGLVDLDLEYRYVVDVGLGDGPADPFPLKEGAWSEDGFGFRLERLEDGWWRFYNHQHSLSTNFDFTEEPRELDWYRQPADRLESHESSPFAKHLVTIRRKGNVIRALVDLTYSEISATGTEQRTITDEDEFRGLLTDILGVDLDDELDAIWTLSRDLAGLDTEDW